MIQGRIRTIGAGTASYSYDILGRLTTETRSLAGANGAPVFKTVSYDYNLDGSLYKHYPSGAAVTYAPWQNGNVAVSVPRPFGLPARP